MTKPRAIRKLLIANRGEIALRIIRTARAMGIASVAVFSEVDADSPHVAAADQAVAIGPADATASYLNADAIIAAALQSGADAIHPGYGFLSENAGFARAVTDADLTFVGPTPQAMAAVGDKLAARRLAHLAGVPVVPGIELSDPSGVQAFAAKVGYPLLIKAAGGGGGRGMRVVERASELDDALAAAAREARAAFGDARVFIEKYLADPRHIEVQILADDHGGAVALGERECSIQRRHQKLVEESPSPALNDAQRSQVAEAALRLVKAAKYRNAGTVEFLYEDGSFYLLEVNARLQVEHPVTEMRFGRDLVAEQLRLAMGERVGPPPSARGSAIECRIVAEDPQQNFMPAVGRVHYLHLPAGPGVRIDTFLTPNLAITSHYDGLLAKLICWGDTREQARRRSLAALEEFVLAGVVHTGAFLADVLASRPFIDGDLSTHFIEKFFTNWSCRQEALEAALIAAVLVHSAQHAPNAHSNAPSTIRSPWTDLGNFEFWRQG